MPKNIIPKDNIPKIEEVREIENYIPTYEEFLKNYNADEKVSDSYENEVGSYSDVRVTKGFGPCNWSNPRCSCRHGEEWKKLRLPCLLEGCKNKEFVEWFHSKNGYLVATKDCYGSCGALESSNKTRVQCRSCGNVGGLDDWKIYCLNHRKFYWEGYLQESVDKHLFNWTGNSNSRWQSDRRNHPNFSLGLTWDRNPNFGRNEWYTNQTFRIEDIETAREVLRWIDNGWLFLRAGFFGGHAYDDVCRRNTKAVAASLRRTIERCESGEYVCVKERYVFNP